MGLSIMDLRPWCFAAQVDEDTIVLLEADRDRFWVLQDELVAGFWSLCRGTPMETDDAAWLRRFFVHDTAHANRRWAWWRRWR